MAERHCPKCGLKQPEENECAGCGIIFSRYHAAARKSSSDGEPDRPTPPPGTRSLPWRRLIRGMRWGMPALALVVVLLALWQPAPPLLPEDPGAPASLNSR